MNLLHIKLTGGNKNYYLSQLEIFERHMIADFENVDHVEYGKQDTRGSVSVSLVTPDHLINEQKHFADKNEMLGFVCGYNAAKEQKGFL